MKKNNPMFVSSTHGAYDFVDFTAPPDQNNPPTPTNSRPHQSQQIQSRFQSSQSQFQQNTMSSLQHNSPQKIQGPPQPFKQAIKQQSPVRQTSSVMRQQSGQFGYNFQPTSPVGRQEPQVFHNQETPLKFGQIGANSKLDNTRMSSSLKGTGGHDFTDDTLIELLAEPHRSNIRTLKMKSKSVPRLTF